MHLHVTSDFIQMINKYYFIYYRRVDIFFIVFIITVKQGFRITLWYCSRHLTVTMARLNRHCLLCQGLLHTGVHIISGPTFVSLLTGVVVSIGGTFSCNTEGLTET